MFAPQDPGSRIGPQPGPVRLPVLEHGRDRVRIHCPINNLYRFAKGSLFRTTTSFDFVRDPFGPVPFASRGANADGDADVALGVARVARDADCV